MTLHEATMKALDELRNNRIFSEVDFCKLMRELQPQSQSFLVGIGFRDINRECGIMYDKIINNYEKIPDDQKPDKFTYFNNVMANMRKHGFKEFPKVLEIMYMLLNN